METTVRKIVREEIGVPMLNFQSCRKITYLDSMLLSTVDGSPPISQITLGAIVGIFTLHQIRSLPDQTDISLSDLMQTREFAVFPLSIDTHISLHKVTIQARENNEVLSKHTRDYTADALERMVHLQS